MAAVPYLVMVPTQDTMPARNVVNGVEGMVVIAETSEDAIAMCKAQFSQDVDALWDNADVTEIVPDTNLHGWSLDLVISDSEGVVTEHVTVALDGTVDAAVAASKTLVSTENYANTETVTVGGKIYVFEDSLTNVANNVQVGLTEALSMANLVAAITHGAGSGVAYAAATTANANVTAASDGVHTITATALVAGTVGNAIAIDESCAHAAWAAGAVFLSGGEDADTFDTMGNAAVAALNATDSIANASYNAGTQVLTVAGAADNLGDHDLAASMLSPDRVRDVPIAGLLGSVVDNGSAGSALSVAFAADAYSLPLAAAGVRQVA